ncbi:MAG: aldehyde ferredoxin oxidoreductase family protein [Desulfobacterales bacterium]|nr:MAG: aldehyde ferredoxin oxidoreductase family protein [Desulfobacterales bacterium]
MKSIWNKILKVDLTARTCKTEQMPDEVYQKFLGGAGMNAYILWRECPRGTTTFDPANRLTFAPGPMQGLKQSGAAKWTAGAISPSINMNADSAATASFGIEIKEAGYDAIVVHGRSDKPVYVIVDDEKTEIKDAADLWGKNAYEAEDGIQEAEGEKFECVTIGQAGELGVRYANIQSRKKSFVGRCGLGAVMGSKMLKGIAIRGSQSVEVHDPKEVDRLNKEINKRLAELDKLNDEWLQIKRVGTALATELFAPQGNLPIKNYQLADFPSGVKNFHASNYAKQLNAKPWPCQYCTIQCHNNCEVKQGPYAYKGKGPEYESFAMVGFNTMVDDIKAVAYACELANLYSMDTISLGVVIAWAMECYEKGVITKKDTYGLDLSWGNAEAMVEIVRKIGTRADGLGYLLGEGTRIASERLGGGSEDWAVQMKGQEIAAHNWRAQYISALNYCTGVASGPNHERGNSQHIWVGHVRLPEWGIDEVENEERWSWNKTADRNAKFHDYCNVINSACHCKFMEFRGYTLTDLCNTINAATGMGWSLEDLRRCGDRITQLQKLLNIRYGWKKEHDFKYPKRFMEPVQEGPAAGKVPVGLEGAIMDYYKERGWDEEGRPTAAKLKEVGLEDFIE